MADTATVIGVIGGVVGVLGGGALVSLWRARRQERREQHHGFFASYDRSIARLERQHARETDPFKKEKKRQQLEALEDEYLEQQDAYRQNCALRERAPRGVFDSGHAPLPEPVLAELAELLDKTQRLSPALLTAEDMLLRGNTLGVLQRYEEALNLYDRALAHHPDDPSTLNNRGIVLDELKRHDEALADYNRSLLLRPDDPNALENRAVTLMNLQRHEEALADLSRVLELRPNDPSTLENRGVVLRDFGRYEEALADFNLSLKLRPGDPGTLNNRGNALHNLKRDEEALADFNRALKLRPDHPETLNNRGITLSALGRYVEALADHDRSLQLRPDHPGTLSNRGITLHSLGRHEEALADFNRSLELRPDHLGTLNSRGITLGHLGRHVEALADFNRALELRPDHPDSFNNRGITLGYLGRYAEALADYNRSLELRPNDAATRNNRGFVLAKMGMPEEALADLNRSLELRPDHPHALSSRGLAFAKLGQYEQASADFARALALKPDHADILYDRACASSVAGRWDEALRDLADAIGRHRPYRDLARMGPDLAGLRTHPEFGPRFQRLLEEGSLVTLPVAEAAIADIQEGRRQLLELVDSLSEADRWRPVPYGQWTIKDLLAHVVGDMTGGILAMLVGGQLDPRMIPHIARSYDSRPINAQQVASRRDMSPQELRELLGRSLEPLITATRQVASEHLRWPIPIGPGYEITVEDWLWFGYHDRNHADDIRRALESDYRPEPLRFLPEVEDKLFWMQRHREGFLRGVYSVADEAWDEPSASPGWTYRDILAHIAANDLRAHIRLRAVLGQRDEAELAALRDVDAWNERPLQERRGRSVRALVDETLALRHETLRLLSQLRPEHAWATVSTIRGETPVLEYIDWVGIHEAEHAGHLVPASRGRRWRAQHPQTAQEENP